MSFKKNTAVTGFTVALIATADGSAVTTGSPVVYVTKDGGTQAAIADTTPVHEGNGQWSFNLTAIEMNANIVGVLVTHTSAINVNITIRTEITTTSDLNNFDPAADTVANITAITGLVDITQTAADKVWSTTARALTDKAGFTISGTLTTLDSLENITAAQVRTQADDALTSYDPPTNAEMQARTPTAAQLAYMVENAATGLPITFTTAGGSTTAAVLNQVDGAGASATNDQYKGRLIVFTNGTLKGVVTDITAYDGTTKVATITAIPFAPDSSHTARLI